MTWEEALEIRVAATNHARFRFLCSDECKDHEIWRERMIEQATGIVPVPAPVLKAAAVPAPVQDQKKSGCGCGHQKTAEQIKAHNDKVMKIQERLLKERERRKRKTR